MSNSKPILKKQTFDQQLKDREYKTDGDKMIKYYDNIISHKKSIVDRDSAVSSARHSDASSRKTSIKRNVFHSNKSSISSISKNYLGKNVIFNKPQGDDDFDISINEDF